MPELDRIALLVMVAACIHAAVEADGDGSGVGDSGDFGNTPYGGGGDEQPDESMDNTTTYTVTAAPATQESIDPFFLPIPGAPKMKVNVSAGEKMYATRQVCTLEDTSGFDVCFRTQFQYPGDVRGPIGPTSCRKYATNDGVGGCFRHPFFYPPVQCANGLPCADRMLMYRVSPEDHALGCLWIKPTLLHAIVEVVHDFSARCPDPEWLVLTTTSTTIPTTATSLAFSLAPTTVFSVAQLTAAASIAARNETDAENNSAAEEQEGSPKSNVGIIVAIVVILLILLAACLTYVFSKKRKLESAGGANANANASQTYNGGFSPSPAKRSSRHQQSIQLDLGLDLNEQKAAMQLNNPYVDESGAEKSSLTPSNYTIPMNEDDEEHGFQMLYNMVSNHYQPGDEHRGPEEFA
jgi:hypothetical protein